MGVVEAAIAPVSQDYQQITGGNHGDFQALGQTEVQTECSSQNQAEPDQHAHKDVSLPMLEISGDNGCQTEKQHPAGKQIVHIVMTQPIHGEGQGGHNQGQSQAMHQAERRGKDAKRIKKLQGPVVGAIGWLSLVD